MGSLNVTKKTTETNTEDLYQYTENFYKNLQCMNKKELRQTLNHAMVSGEIQIYFMPQYDLNTKKIVGVEALSRWITKEGTLNSQSFINILEKHDLIYNLDLHILNYCCNWLKGWINRGNNSVRVSINQSRKNFNKPNYVNKIYQFINFYGVDADLINIEITESSLFNNISQAIIIIKELREIGFKISIDDFGKGYSSLYLLTQIDVDELKIDKCFLENISSSNYSRIILTKVIEMANEVGFQVICEGIETKEQEDFLKRIGCNFGQGFYFAKPMNISKFEIFLDYQNC